MARHNIALTCVIAALLLLVLLVLAPLGHDVRVVKDATLVAAAFGHAVLGLVISLAMWLSGAGVAWLFLYDKEDRLSAAALLGFMIGLPVSAIFAFIALSVPPLAPVLAMLIPAAALVPFYRRRPSGEELRFVASRVLGLIAPALLFGVWMGLELHGPTDTSVGPTFGDLTYYAGAIWSFDTQAWPLRNLGLLGAVIQPPFNELWPAIGAVALDPLGIDPHLFLLSGGGVAFVVNLGLAMSFLFRRIQAPLGWLALAALYSGTMAASWHPSWSVGSIPVIHAVPLAVAAAYWAAYRTSSYTGALATGVIALVGTALSKVTVAAFIGPLMLLRLAPRIFSLGRRSRYLLLLLVAAFGLYAAWMMVNYLPLFLNRSTVGPESYMHFAAGGPLWPRGLMSLGRELGYVACAILAVILLRWPVGLAILAGVAVGLAYPWVFRINAIAAFLVAVALITNNGGLRPRMGVLLVAVTLLPLPASLLADYAYGNLSLVWPVVIGAMLVVAIGGRAPWRAAPAPDAGAWLPWGAAMASVAAILAAIASGHLAVTHQARMAAAELTPAVRDIWRAVREMTPADGLVFTDQVSNQGLLLGGWNTYAFAGQRQIYLSNIFATPALVSDPERREELLAINSSVLNGGTQPGDVAGAEDYPSYYAVIGADAPASSGWEEIYRNADYRLMRIPSDNS